jgi:hypothetical protein
MEEPNYNKRELDHYFQDMKIDIKEILIDGKETKAQVYKTNGRVNKHDWYFKALWWGLGILGTILLLTAGKIITFVSHVYELDREVSQINSNYDITTGK